MRVLFICLGNICRSAAAESILKKMVEAKPALGFTCDSAGTSSYHQGEPADARMRQHASERGYEITSISRQVQFPEDFINFDILIAMDESNYSDLEALDVAEKYSSKLKLMTDYCQKFNVSGVPDPYYGGPEGFDLVIDILEDSITHFIETNK